MIYEFTESEKTNILSAKLTELAQFTEMYQNLGRSYEDSKVEAENQVLFGERVRINNIQRTVKEDSQYQLALEKVKIPQCPTESPTLDALQTSLYQSTINSAVQRELASDRKMEASGWRMPKLVFYADSKTQIEDGVTRFCREGSFIGLSKKEATAIIKSRGIKGYSKLTAQQMERLLSDTHYLQHPLHTCAVWASTQYPEFAN